MLSFHELIFDNVLAGTAAVYTAGKWNSRLASADQLIIACEVSGATSDNPADVMTLTLELESSADDKRFFARFPKTEALDPDEVTIVALVDNQVEVMGAFARVKLTLGFVSAGTNPRARVKAWAVGRCNFPQALPDRANPGGYDTPAVNTQAVVTFPASGTAERHGITGVAWCYDAAPAANSFLSIEDGAGNARFKLRITAAGPGSIAFPVPVLFTNNTALLVKLDAGGAGVTGNVAVLGYFLEFR